MDTAKAVGLAKQYPGIVTSIVEFVLAAAKKDPTLVVDLLSVADGSKKFSEVIRARPDLVYALIVAILPTLGAEGVSKLLSGL